MVRCARCCVRESMRWTNVFVTLCGVAMIIYSLWLQKMWDSGVSYLPSIVNLPRPWFIYTCLGVGIAVCLTTLFGHTIATCLSNSSLCIYLVTLLSLVFLEAAVLVMIFFKMNWSKLITEYIDENHKTFISFVEFHVVMIRVIVFAVLFLQIIVGVFVIILWIIGTAPTNRHSISSVPDFKQSFLIGPIPVANEETITVQNDPSIPIQLCTLCGDFCGRNPRESLLSYVKDIMFRRFRTRITVE